MITEKTHKCKKTEGMPLLEIPERVYEECQARLKKGYSEDSRDDNADSTDRGAVSYTHLTLPTTPYV